MSAPLRKRPIGSLFVEKGFVTQEELDDALLEQRESGQRLGEILVERGHVSRIELASVIGDQLGELRLLRGGLTEQPPVPSTQPEPAAGPDTMELEQRIANQAESIDALLDRINELEEVLAESTVTAYELRVQELEAQLARTQEQLRAAEAGAAVEGGGEPAQSAQLVYAETTEGYRLLSWLGPAPARGASESVDAEPAAAERLVVVERAEPS
jgi:dsDNA-binding SOS-regulon protein